MKFYAATSLAVALLCCSATAVADEITIRIMTDPDASPGLIINEIPLPAPAGTANRDDASEAGKANDAVDPHHWVRREPLSEMPHVERSAPPSSDRPLTSTPNQRRP
jgi:hypothetical protein